MRYVVRALQHREPIAFALSTAADAVAKAWSLMGSGATGIYIYDVNTLEAYFPNEFVGLFSTMATVSQARGRKQRGAIGPTLPEPQRSLDHP
jgi:hypothetical protein